MRLRVLTTLLTFLAVGPAFAVDGKWTPTQILEHDPTWLEDLGLEIPPQELWSAEGAGLLDAVIKIGGCSAGFVSADGLVITNHHCVFGILQHHSTPESDLITDGFIAPERGDEIGGAGTRATIPHQVHDVTGRVEAAVPRGADDLVRYRALDAVKKELVAECETRPARRCQIAVYDGGVRYELVESLEYPDVRLVFSPKRAIGEYGGEVDNWSWPRHTGDFSLARVYAAPDGSPAERSEENVPFRPRNFFPIAKQGVQPGDFILLPGYPGLTYRALIAPEVAERFELYFPGRAALYQDWIDRLTEASNESETARIALASRIKSLANREKNARGQIAGILRGDLLGKRHQADRAVLEFAAESAAHAGAVAAYEELAALTDEARKSWQRDFLLDQISSGPQSLSLASTLVRWAVEKAKPDLEREPDYMERNRDRLRQRLERAQRTIYRPAEEALFFDLLVRLREAGAGELVGSLIRGEPSLALIAARAAELHAATRVLDATSRAAMFEESEQELRDRHDPMLDLAFALDPVLRRLEEQEHRHSGAVSRLRPVWRRAVVAHAGQPVAPDANGTLRVSLAHVQGYAPRDAVWMKPQTTLAGIVAKHTGEEPFAAPDGLLELASGARESRWADDGLGDLPICFLADADTTGGNSGSPVLNGRGELVGVNFDRVWENVANDFGFNPEIARNITADVRYLLWVLEELYPARSDALLAELGVAPAAGE